MAIKLDKQSKNTIAPYPSPTSVIFDGPSVVPYTDNGLISSQVKLINAKNLSEEQTQELNQLQEAYPEYFMKVAIPNKKKSNVLVFEGTRNNRWGQIKDLARAGNVKGQGPLIADSEDGKVVLHPQRRNYPVVKVYTYANGNGELLSFSVNSKYTKNSVELGKTSGIDPKTKEVKTTLTQFGIDDTEGNIDGHFIFPKYWLKGIQGYQGGNLIYGNGQDNNIRNWGYNQEPFSTIRNKPGDNTKLEEGYRGLLQSTLPSVKKNYKEFWETQESKQDSTSDVKTFSSKEDAMSYYQNEALTHGLTEEDYRKFFLDMQKTFDSYKNVTNPQEYARLLHDMNNLDTNILKRKVKIRQWVNPYYYNVSSDTFGDTYSNDFKSWDEAYNYLKTNGKFQILDEEVSEPRNISSSLYANRRYAYSQKKVLVEEELELEIPINGHRALANMDTSSDLKLGNDIEETISNQVKATATVVGDPSLRSSINIQIQNVSSKYSGIWYTKKVTHKFDSMNGYTCDIEFVPRTLTMSKSIIRATRVPASMLKKFSAEAKEFIDSGAMKAREDAIEFAKEQNMLNKETSYFVQREQNSYKVYKANSDMSGNPEFVAGFNY